MKKVIIPFDGSHFPGSALAFARTINESESILLSGVFFPRLEFANLWTFSDTGLAGPALLPVVEESDPSQIEKTIARFEEFCVKNQLEHRIHAKNTKQIVTELKKESRFADLLIMGSESYFENTSTERPNAYLRDSLRQSECPVLIVPEEVNMPENVVVTYDGSESSVFAIKQFAYLFPHFKDKPTVLVNANEDLKAGMPDEAYIKELAARHFTDLTLMRIHLEPKFFVSWLISRPSTIVVCGSFGRTAFSEFVRDSFIADVIAAHRTPIFVTHR